jgi:drug/metabolite transporter (DMT)-like permease
VLTLVVAPGSVSLVQRPVARRWVGAALVLGGAVLVVLALRFLRASGIQALWALGAGFGTSLAAVGVALASLASARLSLDLERREARVVATRTVVPFAKVLALRQVRSGARVQLLLRLEGGAQLALNAPDTARPSVEALGAQLAAALDTALEEG